MRAARCGLRSRRLCAAAWMLLACFTRALATTSSACGVVDLEAAVQRLQQALRFETVSRAQAADHAGDSGPAFDAMQAWLPDAYKSVWSALQVEQAGASNRSYLITWPGSDASLPPVLLISHYDVVPVTSATFADWTHPPFGGAVADGFVWGRGAIDLKGGAVALLEALAALLAQGFRPARTLMLALGHDEEVGGALGAGAIAARLADRGVELEVVWDEGTAIFAEGAFAALPFPTAIVATAEKTSVDVKVQFHAAGGHSSLPPTDGLGIGTLLARFLAALAFRNPPAILVSPVTDFLVETSRVMPPWLGPLVRAGCRWAATRKLLAWGMLHSGASAAALVRTTLSPTIVQAGVAHNVLPQQATVHVNARLLPGHTDEHLRAYLGASLAGVPPGQVDVTVGQHVRPPRRPVTDHNGVHFQLLKRVIQDVWGPMPVVPALLPGGTDSRHYASLSRHGVLRFLPVRLRRSSDDLGRIHGTNERLAVEDFRLMLCTYVKGIAAFGALEARGASAQVGAAAGSGGAAALGLQGREGRDDGREL